MAAGLFSSGAWLQLGATASKAAARRARQWQRQWQRASGYTTGPASLATGIVAASAAAAAMGAFALTMQPPALAASSYHSSSSSHSPRASTSASASTNTSSKSFQSFSSDPSRSSSDHRTRGKPMAADRYSAKGTSSFDEEADDCPTSPLRLMQVHVLFRHGDRSPMPLDSPSKEEGAKWESRLQPRPSADVLPVRQHTRGLEYPFGQLTVKGAEQAHTLGRTLQRRYAAALGLWIPPQETEDTSDVAHQEPQMLLTPKAGSSNADEWSTSTRSGSGAVSSADSPPSFSPGSEGLTQILARSTNFPRTYQSAFFVLKGLLGSESAAAKVPIGIRSDNDENLYENDHCSRGAQLWGRAWRERTSPKTEPDGTVRDVGWRASYQDLKKAMASFFDIPSQPKFPWMLATDNAACMAAHGDPMPDPLTAGNIAAIRDHLAQDYARVFSIREVARLAMGPLLWELHTRMEDCIQSAQQQGSKSDALGRSPAAASVGSGSGSESVTGGWGGRESTGVDSSDSVLTEAGSRSSSSSNGGGSGSGRISKDVGPPPRLLLYSGHDATIMPLAAAIGVAPEAWPPYSSWLAFELWGTHDNTQHFVRVVYNGKEVALPNSVPPQAASASWVDEGPWQRSPMYLSNAVGDSVRERASASLPGSRAGPGPGRNSTLLCTFEHFSYLVEWAKLSPREYEDGCKGPHSNL